VSRIQRAATRGGLVRWGCAMVRVAVGDVKAMCRSRESCTRNHVSDKNVFLDIQSTPFLLFASLLTPLPMRMVSRNGE